MLKIFSIDLNHPAHYLSFGPFSVSAGNLTIIISMAVLFMIALFLPFPNHEKTTDEKPKSQSAKAGGKK
jgi:hypothetical protein